MSWGKKMNENNKLQKNYEDLANAVVERAAKDYRILKNRGKYKDRYLYKSERQEIADLETFFESRQFERYSAIDGKGLLQRLKKELI